MNSNRRRLLKMLGLSPIALAGSGGTDGELSFVTRAAGAMTGSASAVDYADDVVYQIVTDRFRNGDSSNDPSGDIYSSDGSDLQKYHGGDWQGIIEKIQDLMSAR